MSQMEQKYANALDAIVSANITIITEVDQLRKDLVDQAIQFPPSLLIQMLPKQFGPSYLHKCLSLSYRALSRIFGEELVALYKDVEIFFLVVLKLLSEPTSRSHKAQKFIAKLCEDFGSHVGPILLPAMTSLIDENENARRNYVTTAFAGAFRDLL